MGRGAQRNHYGLRFQVLSGLYPLQTVVVSTARHEGLEESLRPRVQDLGYRG